MPAGLSDEELVERLLDVFRTYGYAGTTMSLIEQATGMGRASLYHRFPGGKLEMAGAVMDEMKRFMTEEALAPLGQPLPPVERVGAMIERLEDFTQQGRSSCPLDLLSVGGTEEPLRAQAREIMTDWIDALTALFVECGRSESEARREAEDLVVGIEGSLIVARCLGDPTAFTVRARALAAKHFGDGGD